MRIFVLTSDHFINVHLECAMLRKIWPRYLFKIRKCADALNLGNDQHCVNTNNFPSPLGKLTSAPKMTFPSSGCTMPCAWSAQASSKYTRRPATLLENVPEPPFIISDILTVSYYYQSCLHRGGVCSLPVSTLLEVSSSYDFAQPEVAEEAKFHKAKSSGKSGKSNFGAVTRPGRVSQSRKLAHQASLLAYFLGIEDLLNPEWKHIDNYASPGAAPLATASSLR